MVKPSKTEGTLRFCQKDIVGGRMKMSADIIKIMMGAETPKLPGRYPLAIGIVG